MNEIVGIQMRFKLRVIVSYLDYCYKKHPRSGEKKLVDKDWVTREELRSGDVHG